MQAASAGGDAFTVMPPGTFALDTRKNTDGSVTVLNIRRIHLLLKTSAHPELLKHHSTVEVEQALLTSQCAPMFEHPQLLYQRTSPSST